MARLSGQLAILFLLVVGAGWGLVLTGNNSEGKLPSGTEGQRVALQRFIDHHGDVCSLEQRHWLAIPILHPTLESLINDTDVIVMAHPVVYSIDAPAPDTFVSDVLWTVVVDDRIVGGQVVSRFQLDDGDRISASPALERVLRGLDLCISGPVLLFLKRTNNPTLFSIPYDGWVRTDRETMQAASGNDLFRVSDSEASLLENIRLIVADQQTHGVPKGRLVCESRRESSTFLASLPCPGDTFNPYSALRLDRLAANATVMVLRAAGLQPLAARPSAAELAAIFKTLDVDVDLVPRPGDSDLLKLSVWFQAPAAEPRQPSIVYSPSGHVLYILSLIGQFDAPPAFEEAMKPFLATGSAQ